MTTAADQSPSVQNEQLESRPAEARWWYLSLPQAILVVMWGGLFLWLNRLPLQETDFWGHVAYGRWILTHAALPEADPFAPLLAAYPLFNGAWLSQVIFAYAAIVGGDEALSLLMAVVVLVSCLILARVFYLSSRSVLVAHLGVAVVGVIGWNRIATARPEMFGMLCFSILLWLLATERQSAADGSLGDRSNRWMRWARWGGTAVLMAIWANLHDSFLCGLFVLACWFGGRLIETLWHGRRLRSVLSDRTLRDRLWQFELGLAATCLNPYGARLLLYTLWFADWSQLQQLTDWEPIVIWGAGGRELLISLLAAIFVFRFSGRRVSAADGLLLVVFSLMLAGGLRMLWWYAVIYAAALTPHLADLWQRWTPVTWQTFDGLANRFRLGLPTGRSWSYAAVAVLLAWILFAISPAGSAYVNGSPRPPERLYGPTTPWRLSQYLNEDPPLGPVFNPDPWGDWLAWSGPPGMWIFMTSNMHLTSPDIWIDYRIVRENRTGWHNVLDRYGVRTMVIDNRRQRTMRGYLVESTGWQIVYEDEIGTVFRRVERRPGRRNSG